MTGFTVRTTTEDDWRELRDLRLEMLADTPLAFGEFLEDAVKVDETGWRARAARGSALTSTFFAAISDDGQWIGIMGGVIELGRPVLVGVYVSPAFRGPSIGVADALLAAVEHWARLRQGTLTLHVHADNPRARAFYARRGFVSTGVTVPYRLNPQQTELEMVKRL